MKRLLLVTIAPFLVTSPALAEVDFSQGYLTLGGNPQINMQVPYSSIESDWSEVEGDGFDRFETSVGDTVYEVEFLMQVNDGFSVARACDAYQGTTDSACQVLDRSTYALVTVDRTEGFRYVGVTWQLETGEVLRVTLMRYGVDFTEEELTSDFEAIRNVFETVEVLR